MDISKRKAKQADSEKRVQDVINNLKTPKGIMRSKKRIEFSGVCHNSVSTLGPNHEISNTSIELKKNPSLSSEVKRKMFKRSNTHQLSPELNIRLQRIEPDPSKMEYIMDQFEVKLD